MENENQKTNWVFLPVHKSRVIKYLDKAILVLVDYDRTTIIPRVFKREKEDMNFLYFSLPQDFNANIRVSEYNPSSRRYTHTDYSVSITELANSGLDKQLKDVETAEEQEFVGENTEVEE